MNDDNEQEVSEEEKPSKPLVFVRGFLGRFLIGVVIILIIGLIRPDMRSALVLALAWYSIVCILGGVADVSMGRTMSFNVRNVRLKRGDVVRIVLLVLVLMWIFVV